MKPKEKEKKKIHDVLNTNMEPMDTEDRCIQHVLDIQVHSQ